MPDYSSIAAQWQPLRFEVGSTPNEIEEVIVPPWVHVVRVTAVSEDVQITTRTSGTLTPDGENYQTVFSQNTLPIFKVRRKATALLDKQAAGEAWSFGITAAAATYVEIDPIEEY